MNAPHAPSHARPYLAQTVMRTPLGAMLLACTERGLAGAWFEGDKHHPPPLDAPRRTAPLIEQAMEELQAYWRDARHRFTVPLDPQGSAFQRAVWAQLLRIAPGRTSTPLKKTVTYAGLLTEPSSLKFGAVQMTSYVCHSPGLRFGFTSGALCL